MLTIVAAAIAVTAIDPTLVAMGEVLHPAELASIHRLGLVTALPGFASTEGPHAGSRLLAAVGAKFTARAYAALSPTLLVRYLMWLFSRLLSDGAVQVKRPAN